MCVPEKQLERCVMIARGGIETITKVSVHDVILYFVCKGKSKKNIVVCVKLTI